MTKLNVNAWAEWRELHQKFEFDYWVEHVPSHGHVQEPGFSRYWNAVSEWIGVSGRVLDIGCGPRPPFPPCAVIEPLAEKYKAITPFEWWRDVATYALPAENIVEELRGQFDTVICWNCIDHCADWKAVLDAMLAYAAPDAKLAIATDFHKPFLGHPGVGGRDAFMAEIDRRFKIIKHSQGQQHWRELSLLLTAR